MLEPHFTNLIKNQLFAPLNLSHPIRFVVFMLKCYDVKSS